MQGEGAGGLATLEKQDLSKTGQGRDEYGLRQPKSGLAGRIQRRLNGIWSMK